MLSSSAPTHIAFQTSNPNTVFGTHLQLLNHVRVIESARISSLEPLDLVLRVSALHQPHLSGFITFTAMEVQLSVPFDFHFVPSLVTVSPKSISFDECLAQKGHLTREIELVNTSSVSTEVTAFLESPILRECLHLMDPDSTIPEKTDGDYTITMQPDSTRRLAVVLDIDPELLYSEQPIFDTLVLQNKFNESNNISLPISVSFIAETTADSVLSKVHVDTTQLDFSDVYSGVPVSRSLTLRNTGHEQIEIHLSSDLDSQVWFTMDTGDEEILNREITMSPSEHLVASFTHEELIASLPIEESTSFSHEEDRIEDVIIKPWNERVVTVWFCPSAPVDSHHRLSDCVFSVHLGARGERPISVVSCTARVCTSFVSLSRVHVNFGDVPIHISKEELVVLENHSELPTTIELQFRSSCIVASETSISLQPYASKSVSFQFTSGNVDPDYRKQVTVVNLKNPSNTQTITLRANTIDIRGAALHSLFYRIIGSGNESDATLEFGSLAVNSMSIKTLTVANVSDTAIQLGFESSSPDLRIYTSLKKLGSLKVLTPTEALRSSPSAHEAFVNSVVSWNERLTNAVASGALFPVTEVTIEAMKKLTVYVIFQPSSAFMDDIRPPGKLRHISTEFRMHLKVQTTSVPALLNVVEGETLESTRAIRVVANICYSLLRLVQNNVNFGQLTSLDPLRRSLVLHNCSDVPLLFYIRKSGAIASRDLVFEHPCGIIRPHMQIELHFVFHPSLAGAFIERASVENILDPAANEKITFKADIHKPANFWIQTMHLGFGECAINRSSNTRRLLIKNISTRFRTIKLKALPLKEGYRVSTVVLFELGSLFENPISQQSSAEREEEREQLEQGLKKAIRKQKTAKVIQINERLAELKRQAMWDDLNEVESGDESETGNVTSPGHQFQNQMVVSIPPNAVQSVLVTLIPRTRGSIISDLDEGLDNILGTILVYERNNKEYIRELAFSVTINIKMESEAQPASSHTMFDVDDLASKLFTATPSLPATPKQYSRCVTPTHSPMRSGGPPSPYTTPVERFEFPNVMTFQPLEKYAYRNSVPSAVRVISADTVNDHAIARFQVKSLAQVELEVEVVFEPLDSTCPGFRLQLVSPGAVNDMTGDLLTVTMEAFQIHEFELFSLERGTSSQSSKLIGKLRLRYSGKSDDESVLQSVYLCPSHSLLMVSPARLICQDVLVEPRDMRRRGRPENSTYTTEVSCQLSNTGMETIKYVVNFSETNVLNRVETVIDGHTGRSEEIIEARSENAFLLKVYLNYSPARIGKYSILMHLYDIANDLVLDVPITIHIRYFPLLRFPGVDDALDLGWFYVDSGTLPRTSAADKIIPITIHNPYNSSFVVSVKSTLPGQIQLFADKQLRSSAGRLIVHQTQKTVLYILARLQLPERLIDTGRCRHITGGIHFNVLRMSTPKSSPLQVLTVPFRAVIGQSILQVSREDSSEPITGTLDVGTCHFGSSMDIIVLVKLSNMNADLPLQYTLVCSDNLTVLGGEKRRGLGPGKERVLELWIKPTTTGLFNEQLIIVNESCPSSLLCVPVRGAVIEPEFIEFSLPLLNGYPHYDLSLLEMSCNGAGEFIVVPKTPIRIFNMSPDLLLLSAESSLDCLDVAGELSISPSGTTELPIGILCEKFSDVALQTGTLIPFNGFLSFSANDSTVVGTVYVSGHIGVAVGRIRYPNINLGMIERNRDEVFTVDVENIGNVDLTIDMSLLPVCFSFKQDRYSISPGGSLAIPIVFEVAQVDFGEFSYTLQLFNTTNSCNSENLSFTVCGEKLGKRIAFSRVVSRDTPILVLPFEDNEGEADEWFVLQNVSAFEEDIEITASVEIAEYVKDYLTVSFLWRASNSNVQDFILTAGERQEFRIRANISSDAPHDLPDLGCIRFTSDSFFSDEVLLLQRLMPSSYTHGD